MSGEVMEALLAARALTEAVTPLRADCGRACGHACCQPDETGRGGMLLFPGEEALYRDKAGFAVSRDGSLGIPALLLTCGGSCDRTERPLSCRLRWLCCIPGALSAPGRFPGISMRPTGTR